MPLHPLSSVPSAVEPSHVLPPPPPLRHHKAIIDCGAASEAGVSFDVFRVISSDPYGEPFNDEVIEFDGASASPPLSSSILALSVHIVSFVDLTRATREDKISNAITLPLRMYHLK